MKSELRKWTTIVLTGVMTVGLAGCKTVSSDGRVSQETDNSFGTYVPEYWEWQDDSDICMTNLSTEGNRLYYSDNDACYMYLDLDKPNAEPTVIYDGSGTDVAEEGYEICVEKVFPNGDGIVIITGRMLSVDSENATEQDWIRQQQESTYCMKKVAENGTVSYENDITEYIHMDREAAYLEYALGDGEGNIYLSNGSSYVWIFDKEGKHLNDVTLKNNSRIGDYIKLGMLGDGRVAVATDTNNGSDMNLIAYNVKNNNFSDVYANLPSNCWGTGVTPGLKEGGVLLCGNRALYEYNLNTQTYAEIIKWESYDINSEYIRFTSVLENGNIVSYYDDWNGKTDIILLKNAENTEDKLKEETTSVLTLGYREWKYQGLSQTLESAIMDFNKQSDKYKIEVKGYEDPVVLNNDIIAGSAPDMFVAEDVNIELFAAKGIIEDLNSYLENSQVINRSELFESILDAYTIDGVLCTIPVAMYITTLVGRTSEVGEEAGWSLDEMLALANEHPDVDIFPYNDRNTILYYLLRYNFDSYVNWETGECFFDSGEFKKILELASQYEEDFDDSMSEPEKLSNHKALLCRELFASPTDWQKLELVFGEQVNAIGFPSVKSTGTIVSGMDGICISADSPNKEVAWSFIETLLSKKTGEDTGGMPINKTAYNDMMEKLMEPLYEYDEEENIVLDENGELKEIPYAKGYWEDYAYDMYAVTQEQADRTLELINRSERAKSYGEELWSIIMEETEAFFEGQKTVDDVADIIQNRAKVFVSERR